MRCSSQRFFSTSVYNDNMETGKNSYYYRVVGIALQIFSNISNFFRELSQYIPNNFNAKVGKNGNGKVSEQVAWEGKRSH